MIDYEFSIRTLQAELKHLDEIRKLHGSRVDVLHSLADKTTEAIAGLTIETGKNTAAIAGLTLAIAELTKNVNALTAALLRDHPNGRKEGLA